MAKPKRKVLGIINVEGWMMSYADMATILLAMFIVLSTLGKDQTGVNLYNGTGSFRKALDSFGLPGLFPTSSQAIQLEAPGPHFQDEPGVASKDGKRDPHQEDPQRIIDGEQERMQRFLQEMGRQFQVERMPRISGQTAVDLYDRFDASPPYLKPAHAEVLWQVLPVCTF